MQFRFTIRDLVFTMFWVAVSMAAWSSYFRLWASEEHQDLVFILMFAGIIAPCIAVGAVFAKKKWGLIAGVTLVVLIIVIAQIAMYLGVGPWQD